MNATQGSTDIKDYIARSRQRTWQPLIESGLPYQGISVVSLRYDAATQRSPSILLKFEPGAHYPYHNHPAGEELYVLSGEAIVEDAVLTKGITCIHHPASGTRYGQIPVACCSL